MVRWLFFGGQFSMIFFCQHAVAAAAEFLVELEQAVIDWRIRSTQVDIGVYFGPVFMEGIGSDERREFTVSGDTVNVVSRIEAESPNKLKALT